MIRVAHPYNIICHDAIDILVIEDGFHLVFNFTLDLYRGEQWRSNLPVWLLGLEKEHMKNKMDYLYCLSKLQAIGLQAYSIYDF
jgi:hypothetical protein